MDIQGKLLDDLKHSDRKVRDRATQALWKLWYEEAGFEAELKLQKAARLMDQKKLDEAETLFFNLIKEYPHFAEAHNKLATLLYIKGQYAESVEECKVTLQINPIHFGAWNGMGLCLFHLGRYRESIQCFEHALKIQPHAMINRVYIARCRGNLN